MASAQQLYITLQSFVNSDIRSRGSDGPQLNLPSQMVTCAMIKGFPHLRSDNHVRNNGNTSITACYKGRTSGAANINTNDSCLNVHRVLNVEESLNTQVEDWWRTESFKAKNEEMTYFALKCGGKELHPNRGKMNNSLQYILKIFQLSLLPHLLNNRKINVVKSQIRMHLWNISFDKTDVIQSKERNC